MILEHSTFLLSHLDVEDKTWGKNPCDAFPCGTEEEVEQTEMSSLLVAGL